MFFPHGKDYQVRVPVSPQWYNNPGRADVFSLGCPVPDSASHSCPDSRPFASRRPASAAGSRAIEELGGI